MRRIGFVFYLMALPFSMVSQDTGTDQVIALEKAEPQALIAKDTVALKEIWDEDFMVNAPINKVSKNRREALQLVKSGFISYSSFERNLEEMRRIGDFVITMGNEIVVPSKNKGIKNGAIHRRYTNIWQYKNGHWRMIARHAKVICPLGKD